MAKLTEKLAALQTFSNQNNIAAIVNSAQLGQVMYSVSDDSGALALEPGYVLAPLAVVNNADDLTTQRNSRQSFSEIFNYWQRIAYSGDPTVQSYPDELNAWVYHSDTDKIECTVNSNSLVGFISPDKYDNYTFEVEMSSPAADDDAIGILVGHVIENGIPYTLTVERRFDADGSNGGVLTNRLMVLLNSAQSVQSPGLPQTQVLHIGDDVFTAPTGMWSALTTPIKLKVVKAGNLLTVSSSDRNGSDYVAASEQTIDLSANPDLVRFVGKQPIGYVAQSQASSTWNTVQSPSSAAIIVNLVDNQIEQFDGAAWNVTTGPVSDYIKPNRLYTNTTIGKIFMGLTDGGARLLIDVGAIDVLKSTVADLESRVSALESA